MSESFENVCAALESLVGDARRKARDLARRLSQLETAARSGNLVGIEKCKKAVTMAQQDIVANVEALLETLEDKLRSPLNAEAYLEELETAFKADGLVVRRSGDGYIVPPLYIRVDLRGRSIHLGRQRIRTLRPGAVVRRLKELRRRASRGTQTLLQNIYRAYRFLNRDHGPNNERAVELEQLFQAMSLAPDSDYTREAFALDLVRLEAQPDLRTSDGRRVELVGSTGSRHGKRITAYRDDGSRVDFVAIRFVRDP